MCRYRSDSPYAACKLYKANRNRYITSWHTLLNGATKAILHPSLSLLLLLVASQQLQILYLPILLTYFNNMFIHRDFIAIALFSVSVAFSVVNNVAASPTSSRHLRGPDVELEDEGLLAIFVGEEEVERHLSAATTTPIPEGFTHVPTPTPIPAECSKPCKDDEVCARESIDVRAKCHTKCSAFPPEESCTGNRLCVYSTFDCQGYAGVFNDYCECQQSEGSYLCRPSECGLG